MADVILHQAGLRIALGQGAGAGSELSFDRLIVTKEGTADTATLVLAEPIVFDPPDFEILFDNSRNLRSFERIASDRRTRDRVMARLGRLRKELARQTVRTDGSELGFFGITNGLAATQTGFSLDLPILSPGGGPLIRLRAWASANTKLRARANDLNINVSDIDVSIALEVVAEVSTDGVVKALNAAIRPIARGLEQILPDISGIPFDSLKFDGVQLPDFSFLQLPVPDILRTLTDDLSVAVISSDFTTTVTVQGGDLDIVCSASSAEMVVRWKTSDILKATITDYAFGLQDGHLSSEFGTITIVPNDVAIGEEFEFGGGAFPILGRVRLGRVKDVQVDLNDGMEITATWEFSRIQVEVTGDPQTRLAVSLDVVTRSKNGEVDTSIANLILLDLGGAITLPEVDLPEIPDDFLPIPFIIPPDLTELEEFVKRLARILAALLEYAAKGLGAVAGFLSEIIESAFDVLSDILRKLLGLLHGATKGLLIEVRLDKKTFKPIQIVVTGPTPTAPEGRELFADIGVLQVEIGNFTQPAFVFDLRDSWAGLILLNKETGENTHDVAISTDLWFAPENGPTQSVGTVGDEARDPLIQVTADLKDTGAGFPELVLMAFQDGEAAFFKKLQNGSQNAVTYKDDNGADITIRTVSGLQRPRDLSWELGQEDIDIKVNAEGLREKALALLPSGPKRGGGGLADSLSQRITVTDITEGDHVVDGAVQVVLDVKIEVGTAPDALTFETVLTLGLNLTTLKTSLKGDEIAIKAENGDRRELNGFGLRLLVTPNDAHELFVLSFREGNPRVDLADNAKMEVIYDRLSSSGRGLILKASEFGIGHGGLDLVAQAEPEEPVRLAGVEQAFRFTSGGIRIESGELIGGSLSGSGPLPPALIGDAIAQITLTFGARNGRFKVVAAKADFSKRGEPLYSTGTRFRVTLDKVELDYRDVDSGGEHFFFLLWGEAAFEPAAGEFAAGLMKNLRSVAIKLEAAPLTGDASELLKHISFLVEIDPPFRESLFDIFGFELRGIAFHPRSDAWSDTPPAIGLNGQVFVSGSNDIVQAAINCHELLITYPDSDSPLPRLRADGLTVMLEIGGLARVEATAVAVDDSIPSLYAPVALPADVTANGFLASGRVDISGLGAYAGAMGFLELHKESTNKRKHAMFLYAQAEKLAERVDTPIGPIWIREVGLGLGLNYTLTALAAADQAKSPRELVRSLDEVSKYQGNLTTFKSWTPQFDKDALTLALRGMLSLTSASQSSAAYNEANEKTIANPLLMDIVLALRTDLTFFANVRGWIATNYQDWFDALASDAWKEQPTMRGYLYFSVPRKEFLARFIADGKGHIGNHPELDENFKKALQASRFAATLYIRPGLYHMELGWPYELGFDLGKRSDNFWLSVSGGTIFRIEDATALLGVAFRASGEINFEGRVGGSSLGAAVVARASFAIGAKFIAFLAPFEPKDTMFYGDVYLSITVDFGVSFWLEIGSGRFKVRFSISFSIMLTVSVAAEVVLGVGGVGARVQAAVGVRAFGRTLAVGIGFSFGDSNLERARARVARFMTLGLGVDLPDGDVLHTPAPVPEPARKQRAQSSDAQLNTETPPPLPVLDDDAPPITQGVVGDPITKTEFWAMLVQLQSDRENPDRSVYIMQLLPKDLSRFGDQMPDDIPSTFFAEPFGLKQQEGGQNGPLETDLNGHTQTGDYILRSTDGFPGRVLGDDGWQEAPTTVVDGETVMRLHAALGRVIEGQLNLNTLLADCFLSGPRLNDGSLTFTEPTPVLFASPRDPSGAVASKALREQSTRLDLSTDGEDADAARKRLASINTNERRSALIGKIGESLRDLAERAREPDFDESEWLASPGGIDARHFGLTFRVTGTEIAKWFGASSALTIAKRIGEDSWSDPVDIELLRHPDQSFENREPILRDAEVRQTSRGLDLIWDLEPEFGSSKDFLSDPETFLDYYSIERSFEGIDFNWSQEFRTRTTTPLQFHDDGNNLLITRERAQVHLNDDLTGGGVPEDFRALVLGTPIPSGRTALDVWNDVALGRDAVTVIYKITAVDEMGTQTTQRVLERKINRPADVLKAPISASLTIVFDSGMAEASGSDVPGLAFELIFADRQEAEAEARRIDNAQERFPASEYLLRVRTARILGGGQYGSDAVDDARSAPSAQAIEKKQEDDQDFLLVYAGSGSAGEPAALSVTLRYGDEDEAVAGEFGFEVRLPDGAEPPVGTTEKEALLAALGLVGSLDGNGRRVFLQRQQGTERSKIRLKSSWVIAQTQLIIQPPNIPETAGTDGAKPSAYNSIVEILERPAKLEFPALDRRFLRRDAGRLELKLPDPDMSLQDLLTPEAKGERILRRPDPELRAAVELEVNVHGIQRPLNLQSDAEHPGTEHVMWPRHWIEYAGGFDIFSLDPARLRLTADRPGFDTSEASLRRAVQGLAQRKATIKVLPRSLAGLFPATVPDFKTLAPHYPSLSRRTDPARSRDRREAPWYGPAESLVAFPTARLRRWLLPDPSEASISHLLDRFDAQALEIEITHQPLNTGTVVGRIDLGQVGFSIDMQHWSPGGEPDPNNRQRVFQKTAEFRHITTISDPDGKALRTRDIRAALRSLRFGLVHDVTSENWSAQVNADRAYAEWRRSLTADRLDGLADELNHLNIQIKVSTIGKNHVLSPEDTPPPRRREDFTVALHSDLHPVLEDALAELAYAPYVQGSDHPGEVYRAYESVREPRAPLDIAPGSDAPDDAKPLEAFLDAFSPTVDPIGWGALRALGLAEGLRVYDIERERYVAGGALLNKVNEAFAAALSVYGAAPEDADGNISLGRGLNDPRNLGAPFVELLGQASAFMSVGSYDGSDPANAGDWEDIDTSSEANIVQISLRPRPAQQAVFDNRQDNEMAPYPVQYLVLRKADDPVEPPQDDAHEPITLDLGDEMAFVADLILQADVTNQSRSRQWMPEELANILFDPEMAGERSAKPVLTSDMLRRISALKPGEIVGYLRIACVGRMHEGVVGPPALRGIWQRALDRMLAPLSHIVVPAHDMISHPRYFAVDGHPEQSAPIPFDRFSRLAPELLGMIEFGVTRAEADGPHHREWERPLLMMLCHLPPGLAPRLPRWHYNDTPVRKDIVEVASDLAARMSKWSERFLRHGTGLGVGLEGPVDSPPTDRNRIDLALIGMTTEDAMARVPDANGRVRVFFVEPTRNGREVLYAVRPFGRYALIDAQLSGRVRVPELASAALETDWKRKFVHASLPRSRPLDKPAILSIAQIPGDGATHAGEVELVVGRTPDQMIALGNTPAERALQPAWSAVELRADFPAKAEGRKLFGSDFDWKTHVLSPSDDQTVSATSLTGEIITPDDLLEMRRRVPDAWRGSVRYGFRGLPHFLRVTALAHQSAGVVVSDPSGVVLPEAGGVLRFPPVPVARENDPGDPRPGWGVTADPFWWLERIEHRTEVDGTYWPQTITETLVMHFDLPMIRNLDLMPDVDLRALTAGEFARVPGTYRLPDAKVSYQIAALSNDNTVVTPQIEILPTVEGAPGPTAGTVPVATNPVGEGLYAGTLSGRRFTSVSQIEMPQAKDAQGQTIDMSDEDAPEKTANWRLKAQAELPDRSVTACEFTVVADLNAKAQSFGEQPSWSAELNVAGWSEWAPRRKVTIVYSYPGTNPDATKAAAKQAHDALARYIGDFGALRMRDLLLALSEIDDSQPELIPIEIGENITVTFDLPMGIVSPTGAGDLRISDSNSYLPRYHWQKPDEPYDFVKWMKHTRAILTNIDDPDRRDFARELTKNMRDFDVMRLRQETLDREITSVVTSIEPKNLPFPFLFFEWRRFKPDDPDAGSFGRRIAQLIVAIANLLPEQGDPYLLRRYWEARVRGLVEFNHTGLNELVLPLPAILSGQNIEAPEWSEARSDEVQMHLGLHRLPSETELDTLTEVYPQALETVEKLIEAELLGAGGVRVTAFRGAAAPASLRIKPKIQGGQS